MRLKSFEEKYLISASIDETQCRVQQALEDVGLKGVTIKKHVPPRYLLIQYSPSWVGKALEIEFLFTETEKGTEVAVKWPYTKELPLQSETSTDFLKHQEKTRQKTEQLIEAFKLRIGASNVPT